MLWRAAAKCTIMRYARFNPLSKSSTSLSLIGSSFRKVTGCLILIPVLYMSLQQPSCHIPCFYCCWCPMAVAESCMFDLIATSTIPCANYSPLSNLLQFVRLISIITTHAASYGFMYPGDFSFTSFTGYLPLPLFSVFFFSAPLDSQSSGPNWGFGFIVFSRTAQ